MHVGIDLGGTKISAIVLAEDGTVKAYRKVATPRHDPQKTLDVIVALVEFLALPKGQAIGVGIPGSLSPRSGRMRNANSTWLSGLPLQDRLQNILRRPIRTANDADCFAISESFDGAAAGYRTVFAGVLGTGVGAGVIANGRLLIGPNGMAAEWGHVQMPRLPIEPVASHRGPDPGACYCGRRNCIETYLSGPGLVARHWAETGEKASSQDIAKANTPARAQSMARYKDRLASALGIIITLFDPELIVLGGGLSDIDALYPDLDRRAGAAAFCVDPATPIRRSQHGPDSGVRGAARLWSLPESSFTGRPSWGGDA